MGAEAMDVKKVRIGNAEIAYYDEGKGLPVVLVHGFAGGKSYWDEVIPGLAGNYRVVAFDLPGHGESGMAKDRYPIEDMASAAKELLDKLGLEKVAMFGHSLGGYITLAFAELYPKYLNGFSLIHSTASPDTEEAKAAREQNARKVQEEGPGEFIEGLSKKLFSPDNLDVNSKEVDEVVKIGMQATVDGLVSALKAMKERPDRTYILKETELPVLLIAGEQDQIVPPEKTFTVTKQGVDQHVIKGAGHMSMYEKPDELVKLIYHFLSKL